MDLSTIMVGKSFQKKSERFILRNVSSPIMDEGYELFPADYISFPCFEDYKKIKKINKTIARFLERRREINNVDEVLKCLELIESFIEGCDVMRLGTNDECSFNEAFPGIIEFIERVGYDYEDNELVDVGYSYEYDDFVNESKMIKEKYINIVEKLYKKKIWPFAG